MLDPKNTIRLKISYKTGKTDTNYRNLRLFSRFRISKFPVICSAKVNRPFARMES